MNVIRIVRDGPDKGLYLNGVKVPGVLKIEPDLFGNDCLPVAVVTLSINSFAFEPAAPIK